MITFKDFRFGMYRLLLETLKEYGYIFYTYESFISKKPEGKAIIIRHDIDYKPENSVKMAILEKELAINCSYYFGFINDSFSENAINKIVQLGHELGYHYNDLASAKGNFQIAIQSFSKNLEIMKQYYPVKTICMHGSPLSIWDNRLLWAKYDYSSYGIISEPYLDLDFNEIFYMTDSSRSWNNLKFTIRDKVNTIFKFKLKNTLSIIELIKQNKLPEKIMINLHPHNWSDSTWEWLKVLAIQTIKNQAKRIINQIYN